MRRYILLIAAVCSIFTACHKADDSLSPVPNPPDLGNSGNTKPAIVVESFHALGGTISYDDSTNLFYVAAFSNDNKGEVMSGQGGTVITELDGIEHGTVTNNNQGTLVLKLPKTDTAIFHWFVLDDKGDTTTEYRAIVKAGGEIGVDGKLSSFQNKQITYDANYIKTIAKANNQKMLVTQPQD